MKEILSCHEYWVRNKAEPNYIDGQDIFLSIYFQELSHFTWTSGIYHNAFLLNTMIKDSIY